MHVEKLILYPSYRKDNGLWALNTQNLVPKDKFTPVEQFIIRLPPLVLAGNHKHHRKEALLGIGVAVYFLWEDERGKLHEEAMNPDNKLYLFTIPPNIPHAVVNKSLDQDAILYEYFDDVYREVEKVNLVENSDSSK